MDDNTKLLEEMAALQDMLSRHLLNSISVYQKLNFQVEIIKYQLMEKNKK